MKKLSRPSKLKKRQVPVSDETNYRSVSGYGGRHGGRGEADVCSNCLIKTTKEDAKRDKNNENIAVSSPDTAEVGQDWLCQLRLDYHYPSVEKCHQQLVFLNSSPSLTY